MQREKLAVIIENARKRKTLENESDTGSKKDEADAEREKFQTEYALYQNLMEFIKSDERFSKMDTEAPLFCEALRKYESRI